MKKIITSLLLFVSIFAFAQESAIADIKFEEAETTFNNQDYETTIKKLDEFDKLLGSIKDKSLYLRIISQDKLFDPTKLYESEKKNKELEDFYRELTPKIEAWEWDEKIKIGADFKDLKKQYPDYYKEFNENPKKNDNVNGNIIIRDNKKNDISRISHKEIVRITTEFGNIVLYSIVLNESYALKILNMWKQEFGENAINEYSFVGNRPNYKIGMYVLESPKREKKFI